MEDNEWLSSLYIEHAPALYRLAARKLWRDPTHAHDAEDVLQEVFMLALVQDIRLLPCPADWLFRTTVLVCRRWNARMRRRAAQRQQFFQYLKANGIDEVPAPSGNAPTDAQEKLEALEQLLPHHEWMLLKAYLSKDVSPQTLARQQGISLNNLRVRIHRLRTKLKAAHPMPSAGTANDSPEKS